ncbi:MULTISPECIES: F0F1 ATP synthase subunit delta [unclassified Luteococcus]|uniref:F0F1 ATP synthase subunit delta n=1 Tax=unclassified Luteococcus TaxID=2639923 RepID=UPI00313C0C8F
MTLTATEQARRSDLDNALADQSFDGATPGELFAVVDVLDSQSALKRALTDPATAAEARQQMAERLLEGKVGGQTIWIVKQAVAQRWNSGRGLADALERQAVRGQLRQAQDNGCLDEVTEQLLSFRKTVESSPELREALANRSTPLEARQQLVHRLLEGKAHGWVEALAARAAGARERTFDLTVGKYLDEAAELRNRDVAKVTVARPMDEDQKNRLRSALSRIHGRDVDIQLTIDPSVMGGVRVELGNEIIEGTVADRLEQVHRQLS